MQLSRFIICFCCAGLVLLTGCAAGGEQTQAVNSPTGAVSPASGFTATARPGASNTLKNTPTPVKPTNPYTSREPYYTFNPPTPTPTPTPTPAPPAPVIAGAEFVRPGNEEIAELKEAYEEELDYDDCIFLKDAGAIVAFETACVGYDFGNFVLKDYDWEKGMPSVEDVLNNDELAETEYMVPIYSRDYKLIGYMCHHVTWRGEKSSHINLAKDDGYWDGTEFIYPENDYWEETAYDAVLTLHMKAHYVYEAVQEAQLGNIKNMILFNEDCNYNYCVVETNKGSYAYAFPYESNDGGGVDLFDNVKKGTLYTDAEEFRRLYTEQMNNPHFVEGGLVFD